MKTKLKKGAIIVLVDGNGNDTHFECDLDIDRELEIDDTFNWHNRNQMKVIKICDLYLKCQEI